MIALDGPTGRMAPRDRVVVYVAMMIATFRNRQIGARGWLRTFIASLVPLGTFANDQWLKRLAEKRT